MATVTLEPGKAGSAIRPYGYEVEQQLDGTTTDVIIKIPSDVFLIGVHVTLASAGSYWLKGSMGTNAEVAAGTEVFDDIVGDGSTAINANTIGNFDGGFSAIKVTRVTGSPLVNVTMRRN